MKKPKNKAMAATNWAVEEVDQLFVTLARYTRFVLFSKWFLGVFALLLLVGLIAWPFVGKDKTGMRVSFVSTEKGTQITQPIMESPRFEGSDNKNQRYAITAKRAIQLTPQLVQLEAAEGQLLRADGSAIMLRADTALFHQDTKIVEVQGNVSLMDDKGTMFTTNKMQINTATMDVDGAERIEGIGPNGKLVATGFKIRDSGNRIIFGTVPRVTLQIEKMRRG